MSGLPIKITKGVTLLAGSNQLELTYLLEGLPADYPLHFGVEFNFAGLPSGADDRYFYRDNGQRLGQLQTELDLQNVSDLGLVDEWLGINVKWTANQPSNLWAFPIETVSQSEGGFELVHQSVCLMPHWFVRGDAGESFDRAIDAHIKNVRRKLEIDTRNPRYILTVYGVGYKAAES